MDKKLLLAAAAALATTVTLAGQAEANTPAVPAVVSHSELSQVTIDAHGRPMMNGQVMSPSDAKLQAHKTSPNFSCNSGCGPV